MNSGGDEERFRTIVSCNAKLLLNLRQVGPADESRNDDLPEVSQELNHLGRRVLRE